MQFAGFIGGNAIYRNSLSRATPHSLADILSMDATSRGQSWEAACAAGKAAWSDAAAADLGADVAGDSQRGRGMAREEAMPAAAAMMSGSFIG
jgi:hypothetical protein